MQNKHIQNVIDYYEQNSYEVLSTSTKISHDGYTTCGFDGQPIPKGIIYNLTVRFKYDGIEYEDYWSRDWYDGPDINTFVLITHASHNKEMVELPAIVHEETRLQRSAGRL